MRVKNFVYVLIACVLWCHELYAQQGPLINKQVPGVPGKQKGIGQSIVNCTFIQMNDVYEIAPVQQGKNGGLARVATIVKRNKQVDPNTFSFLSGDFLSPSAAGLATDESGKLIKGKQMVDVLNKLGLDYVTFGNHEFDVKEDELQQRINESKFNWVSSNVYHQLASGVAPFSKTHGKDNVIIPKTSILSVTSKAGNKVKIGMMALTLPANKQPWVFYDDFIVAAENAYDSLKNNCDFVIAITHLTLEEDKMLARAVPELRLIMGGHEHENILIKYGNTYIAKADANAVTVYIHHLRYNVTTKELLIQPTIRSIDSTTVADTSVAKVVDYWMNTANKSFAKQGFDPKKTVTRTSEIFDGYEKDIRFMQTNLGELVCKAMLAASGSKTDAAILNSGSIRIDDVVTGEITQYDVLRVLPFGGQVLTVEMKGSLLKKVLDIASVNLGSGGYLQYTNITKDKNGAWLIKGKNLEDNSTYTIALNDFLISGRESKLDFFNAQNPEIGRIVYPDAGDNRDLRNDIRKAVIDYMQQEVR